MPFVWVEMTKDQFMRSDRIDGVAVRSEIVSDKGADTAVPVLVIMRGATDRVIRFPSYPNALDRQREIMQAIQDSEDAAPAPDPRQDQLPLPGASVSGTMTREMLIAELRAKWADNNKEFEKAKELTK